MEYEFETIRGADFGEEKVPADGREFIDCTFNGSTLVFRGVAPFIIAGSSREGDIPITFTEHAATTLDQLRAMYRFGQGVLVEQIIESIRNPFQDTRQ